MSLPPLVGDGTYPLANQRADVCLAFAAIQARFKLNLEQHRQKALASKTCSFVTMAIDLV